MIRLLVAIAILFALVLGLDYVGALPVSITVEWPGGAMAPPLRVVVVALALFAVAAVIGWRLFSLLLGSPFALDRYFRGRRRDRGYRALSRGMIAVGAGNSKLAHRFAAEAKKRIGFEPLVMLLEAQTAQIEGRSDAARVAFSRMLENEETRLLGLRGLFIEATRAGELSAARHYAAEAQRLSPGLPWAGLATMEYQSAEEDWAGALATLEQNRTARLVDKAGVRRLRAVLLTARALQSEDGEPERARGFAVEAHRLAPDLVPAAVVAARLLARLHEVRRAAKTIETTWKIAPHPELSEAYLHIRSGDSTHDRLKRAKVLLGLKPNHIEGIAALARAALDAQEFALARETLAKALRQAPSQRVCLMMAELEEREHGDRGRVREWLARAVRAPRDEAWTADGIVAESWHPLSPVTGRLDAFEWKVPVSTESGVSELDGSDLAEKAVLPLEAAALSSPNQAADERLKKEDLLPVAAEREPKTAMPPSKETAAEAAAEVTLPFRPDDPGPEPESKQKPPPLAAFS